MENNLSSTKRPLFNKDFSLVLIGQIISLFGNAILRFALPLYILQQSGSPALFGLVSASSFLPMVILSPIGGMIADRMNKQRIMVVLDTITAILIGLFMFLHGAVDIVPLVVILLIMLYGIQGVYSPAVQASIPLLASDENLMPANAAVNLVQSLSGLLGPVAGGMLFGQFGLMPIMVVGCVCFAFSAFIELFIRIPHKRRPAAESIWAMVKDDMGQSVRFVTRENPVLGKVTILIFCINLFMSSMIIIGLPVIITGNLGMNSEWYGAAQGALAAGGLLGGLLAGMLSKWLSVQKAHLLLLACAICIVPMGLVLALSAPVLVSYFVITAASAVMMAFSTIFSIQMLAFVQAQTPPHLIGKVVSFVLAISMCAQPFGQALYGVLFEQFADASGMVVLAAGLVSAMVALYSKSAFGQLRPAAQSG